MRVVVAPDKFGGTLSAGEAAGAIAEGWARVAPWDEVIQKPLSDGGPGFLEVLGASLGGSRIAAGLRVGDDIYIESAEFIGLGSNAVAPEQASSTPLGVALANALADRPRRIVIGLGGTGTNDGGAGLLAVLGATADAGYLDRGPAGLSGIAGVDLSEAVRRCEGVEVVIATDVDNPLTGLFGATKVFGPQKGIAEDRLPVVDGCLQDWAAATGRSVALAPGAGAAGGVGFALMLLGGRRVPGLELVAREIGFTDALADAELVLTGEGSLDFSSAGGKVPIGVARLSEDRGVPCVALAGEVHLGARELRSLGIQAAYSMSDLVGRDQALESPAEVLSELAAKVARTWSF